MPEGLDSRYAEVLAFEAAGRWTHAGIKEAIVRDRFDISYTRYSQILHHVLNLPAALVWDPATVTRLRRIRDARAAHRRGTIERPTDVPPPA